MKWLQNLLGIDIIFVYLYDIRNNRLDDRELLKQMEIRLAALESAIGRIVAKLDPIYGISDLDPSRKAASDALGIKVINHMQAEEKARRHMKGEL